MPDLTLVDALLIALVLLAAWAGWQRGFVYAALGLLALVAAAVAALQGHAHAAALLRPHLDAAWARPVAFIGVFAVVRIGLGVLLSHAARRLPGRAHAHPFNRAAGLLPGALSGLVDATLAVMVLLALPLPAEAERGVRDSVLAQRLSEPAEWMEAALTPIFDEAARRAAARLAVPAEPREPQQRIELPFAVHDARRRPDLEARMLEMVNAERAREGLKPLSADPQLAEVAVAHSRDMFARSYFSHVSPEGTNAFERMRRAKVRFRLAGENLALAPTLPLAHEGLMNSPGHRANILRPGFTRAGIGILDGGRRGLMVTQLMAA